MMQNSDHPFVALSALEPVFTTILAKHGKPPRWQRPESFATLLRIILEQQVSLASAKAAYERLCHKLQVVEPLQFMQLSDKKLKTIGFSRQKTAYGRNLATAMNTGGLNLAALAEQSDHEVRAALTSITGIGNWTANIYLLMAMQRPDIWPSGDIALAAAYQMATEAVSRPDNAAMQSLAEAWRPYRSTAARLLWHFYLSER